MKSKFILPNASDSIPFAEMFSETEIKENKISIDIFTLMGIVSDLHYLWGVCDALQNEIETKKD